MQENNPREFFIQWHLTERCNLNCTHCYQTGEKFDELDGDEIRAVLDEIAEMFGAWEEGAQVAFTPGFNVTGGEPFLRNDLFEILARMRAMNFDTYLLTNGTLIDAGKAGMLAELGVKGVQVSIEGPKAIHESIRGVGSFETACRGVSHLLDAGLRVTLNATLSGLNADCVQGIIDLAADLGVQRLGFSRLVPSGKGLGLVDRMLDTREVRNLYERIFFQSDPKVEMVSGDPVATQLRNPAAGTDGGDVPAGGCSAGVSGLTLLADGTVVPCRRLALPLGNVRTDSLREIWTDSPVLEQLRNRALYKGKCGSCPRWSVCRGCRAIAFAHSGTRGEADLLAEDPQCFIET